MNQAIKEEQINKIVNEILDPKIDNLKTEMDNMARIYVDPTPPINHKKGDLWLDTSEDEQKI